MQEIELKNVATRSVHRAIEAFTLRAFESEAFCQSIEKAAEIAQETLEVDTVVILRVDYENDQLETTTHVGAKLWDHVSPLTQLSDDSWVKHVVRSSQCVRVDDTLTETRFTLLPYLSVEQVRSGLFVAIRGLEDGPGIVAALHSKPRDFTEDHVEFLQTLSHLVGVVQQRRKAADRLRLRDRALESISQGIIITDEQKSQPTIIYANDAFCRMTGFSLTEVIGMPSRRLHLDEKNSNGLFEQLALHRAKGRHARYEAKAKRKDGTSFVDSVRLSPITNDRGVLTNYVAVHEDVTQVREREIQLQEAHKMEAIGQLTGGIAHDFNNLLTVILANIEDLSQNSIQNDLERSQAELIRLAAIRGGTLVKQLMAFARKQELSPTVTNVNHLISGFAQLLRRTLPENIEIELCCADGAHLVMIDAHRLENALLNLCLNARDAMPSGGYLVISSRGVKAQSTELPSHLPFSAEGYLCISVADNGSGMPESVVKRAFDPFFTTKSVDKGTGLGLSMVYGFVKQSGGEAAINSSVGIGTEVCIYLPVVSGEISPERHVNAISENISLAGIDVLVVEDDDLVRESLCAKLTRMGLIVESVASARAALDAIEKKRFDLLFSDVIMPGMNGADLVRNIRKRRPDVRALLTSGYAESGLQGKIIIPEGTRLLSKPYSSEELKAAIREAIA